jgi:hypothetical protein
MVLEQLPDPCPLCERPNFFPSDHHMVPRSRGGRSTETICADCHRSIHSVFTNKQLEKEYHTAEALLAHPTFAKAMDFLRKQDPRRRCRMVRTKERRKERRNG